jgi:hypothetical protein
LIKRERLDFFYNWCSLTTPYSTRGHIKVGDIYILYIFTKHKLTQSSTTYTDICQCRIVLTTSSQSQSHIATDGQSASKSWCRAPSGAYDQIFIAIWQLRSCILWGALSDERTGLYFVYAAGPCQRSLSRVRVPWYSRPYFTVSDLRLPFSSPPTTRRVTVEVFDPTSTRVKLPQLGRSSDIASERTA